MSENATEVRDRNQALLAAEVADVQLQALRKLRESISSYDWQWNRIPGTGRDDGTSPTGNVRNWTQQRTLVRDRTEGRYLPHYETEIDLSYMRSATRNLATFSGVAIGAGEALVNYVMGGEWTYEVTDLGPASKQLVARAQRVVDDFLATNEWEAGLELELFGRLLEDGDILVALYPEQDRIAVDLVDADKIKEPSNGPRLNEWLGVDHAQWNFGIHAPWLPNRRKYDYSNPLGYYVSHDDSGIEWDYLPRWPQPRVLEDCRCGTMLKSNVPRDAARGISDWWPIVGDVEGEWKLARGTREGATLQSHIAWIEEHAPGTTSEMASALASAQALYDVGKSNGTSESNRYMGPGTILSVENGRKFLAGPMGSLNSSIFMDVAQFILRRIGVRWSMPEYLVSGDASNGNYASSLVAESPFVKYCERRQKQLGQRFRAILTKVLRIAFEQGHFRGLASSWEQVRQSLDVLITAPEVASRDNASEAQSNEILFRNGILDGRTWATKSGLDPDLVRDVPHQTFMPPTPGGFTEQQRRQVAAQLLWEAYP